MVQKRRISRHLLPLIGCVVVLGVLIHARQVNALDYELHQTIIDPNAPVDVCPNIGGVQVTIPSGMELDSNGNCYTPTPPTPTPTPTPSPTPTPPTTPVTTDLCSNINGTQTSLPSGYYRTTAGTCYVQPAKPAEPVDVCTNLEEIQLTVPDGYYLDTDNLCREIPPATDVCSNIDGPQTALPDGMVVDDTICYTPETTTTPTSPSTPTPTTKQELANVPEALTPLVQPLVNLIPEGMRTWLKSLPPTVAKTAPYYIFGIVGLLALGVLLQSIREAEFVKQLVVLLKRERDIAEQKDMFIALASHYLRTPLTLMESSLDTMLSLQETTQEAIQPLLGTLQTLQGKIDTILKDVQQNTGFRGTVLADQAATQMPSVWRSPFFWGPLVASVVLSILANFFFGIVGNQTIGTGNFLFQIVFALAVTIVLYITVRNLYVKRRLNDEQQRLIAHEKTIDEARNVFIAQTTVALKESLAEIDLNKQAVATTASVSYFTNGYERFHAILEKFLLLSQVQAGTERMVETVDVRQAIDAVLARRQSDILAKQLTVTNTVDALTTQQNKTLFDFVISSLIDNAIKFNELGGSITISAKPAAKVLVISVTDNGIGIDESKLGQLFQPFTRATPTMEFNYEGLGFSLFLDKIIMDYTGGTIAAESELQRGTNLTITSPIATS